MGIQFAWTQEVGTAIKAANGAGTTYLSFLTAGSSYYLLSGAAFGDIFYNDMGLAVPAGLPGQNSIELPTASLEGLAIHATPSKEIARHMAVLPQKPSAPAGLTVEELVAYGRFPHKRGFGSLRREDYRIIDESMQTAGIAQHRDALLGELSGGQCQRVWIAMTLCQKTDRLQSIYCVGPSEELTNEADGEIQKWIIRT